ncbi:VIT domain-containing protein, partial [Stackebrandtia soli]|uniref:VIT domain-containing protein n=1 Tax=Stackebrandtia soli TaxID=1892856 RepID=UPI0039E967D7
MTMSISALPETLDPPQGESGLGALSTERGNLPLRGLDISVDVTGLSAKTTLRQRFHNPHAEAIEATYIFPLPERAALTDMTMTVAGRVVTAELRERGEARAVYDQAIAAGQRAAIAEAERSDVFTMRVGNIAPGEEAVVTLTTVGPLSYEDGEAGLRLPLVVAPRFIPGKPLPGESVGDGVVPDTDAVPDASRIRPPVLLPGFPNPVDLSIAVNLDSAGFTLRDVRSSLHAVVEEESTDEITRLRINPGERVNRDFILRFAFAEPDAIASTFEVADGAEDGEFFRLTVLPPQSTVSARPKDVVVLLDRSGSMGGWKIVAARRAAARIVDTLQPSDRFAVRCFDHDVTSPPDLGPGLVSATDRHRYRAVEHLARSEARGGTVMLAPLTEAADLLSASADTERDRVLILVTDGQVGNEDQILAELSGRIAGVRVHVVGIDRAVNAGFLHRLALAGRGRCELVESEDRLDEACAHIHRRIVAPVVTNCQVELIGAELLPDSLTPSPIPDLFTGVPLVVSGRVRAADETVTAVLAGIDAEGKPWRVEVPSVAATGEVAVRTQWARARLRDLEDRYASAGHGDLSDIEKQIVDVSLSAGVMSKFTAFVAVDEETVEGGGTPRKVVQPVELPDGWQPPTVQANPYGAQGGMRLAAAPVPAAPATMDWMSAEVTRGSAEAAPTYGGPPPPP